MMMRYPVVNGENIEYGDVNTDFRGFTAMATDIDWAARVKGLLKAELKRRNVSYRELADKLSAIGVHDTERNIANKIARGGFTAVFFVQCLESIGCSTLKLSMD